MSSHAVVGGMNKRWEGWRIDIGADHTPTSSLCQAHGENPPNIDYNPKTAQRLGFE